MNISTLAPPASQRAFGVTPDALRHDILHHLRFTLAELPKQVDSLWEPYVSLALAVRDRLIESWVRTQERAYAEDAKRVYYLSLEFLMGRTLGNAAQSLDITEACRAALQELGYTLEDLREAEWDAGLGNGGLGRLAACFLDSLATLRLPAYGYGIRYEYGIFHQRIVDGAQVEVPDTWLEYGNPWEIARPNDLMPVRFHGRTEHRTDEAGRLRVSWVDGDVVMAMPYDTPIPGFRNDTVNTLRLWSAKASREFGFAEFDAGDYRGAVEDKIRSENITKVLYPNDNSREGRTLRLKQEYFFVSATLRDIFRRYKKQRRLHDGEAGPVSFDAFPRRTAIQLNDTHPALAVPELMRLLVDEEGLAWDEAWAITVATLGYTNHTVMPEALERWPVWLVADVLPRHLEIVFEINRRFLDEVRDRFPGDPDRARRMSIIEEGPEQRVRMAHLAIVGSHSVNGVAALHTEILKADLFKDFFELWPAKFNNKTNGVTQRRWLLKANPRLSELISDKIGSGWTTDLAKLQDLLAHADDPSFQGEWQAVKRANKVDLARTIVEQYRHRGLAVDVSVESLFDCQVKRFHEYKRQLLNLLHAITLYHRIRDDPDRETTPRTILFGGKAAPGYARAKSIIRLINAVGAVVNADPRVGDRLRVVFLADYRVSLAEKIFPAAELSEQISLAGTEASGTGNMKFSLNGALTIGTLDGANVEICEEVGTDQIFIFGMTADEVRRRRSTYSPLAEVASNAELARVLESIASGLFSPTDPDRYRPIVDSLLERDEYMLLADYAPYVACQQRVAEAYRDPALWTSMSIRNVARMGKFSTDRTIREYADEIWGVRPIGP